MKKINFLTALICLVLTVCASFSASRPSEEEMVKVYKIGLNPKTTKTTSLSLGDLKDKCFLYFKTAHEMLQWSKVQEMVSFRSPALVDIMLNKLRLPLRVAIGKQLVFFADFEEFDPDCYFNTEDYKRRSAAENLPSMGAPAEIKSYEAIMKTGEVVPYLPRDLMQFLAAYCNARSIALAYKRELLPEGSSPISLLQERASTREYFWRHYIPSSEEDQKHHANNIHSFVSDGQEAEIEIGRQATKEGDKGALVVSLRRMIKNQKKQLEVYYFVEENETERQPLRLKVTSSMIKELCTIFSHTGDFSCLKEARTMLRDLKRIDSNYEELKTFIDMVEDTYKKETQRTQRHIGSRAQKQALQNIQKENPARFLLETQDPKSMGGFDFAVMFDLKDQIETFYRESPKVAPNPGSVDILANFKEALRVGLEKMENPLKLAEEKKIGLEEKYANFMDLIPWRARENIVYNIIVSFILSEDLEGALKRAEVCRKVMTKQDGKDPEFLIYLIAYIKNLQGQPQDLNDLLEKKESEKAARLAQKEVRKKGLKTKMATLARAAAQAVALEEKEVTPKAAVSKPKVTSSPSKSLFEFPVEEDEDFAAEKAARHAQAIARRAAEKARRENPEASGACAAPESSAEEDTESPEEDARPLGELMDFTHATANVDEEIEGNTWRFSRADLVRYYKQFGCTFSQSGTSHVVARLPELRESLNVVVRLPDRGLLTVLVSPDSFTGLLGGASTFPNWDQNFVPYYMRTQILEARVKLKAIVATALEQAPEGARVSAVTQQS